MRISPGAAQQMYPHLGSVECESHGTQPRAKVPSSIAGVFAGRPNPQWVCAGCVTEAREQWEEQQRELKQQNKLAKEAQRTAIKDAREAARNADKALAEYANRCQDAVGAVKTAESDIDVTRSKLASAKNKALGAKKRFEKARDDYNGYETSVYQLLELSSDQFEVLDNADSRVIVCYNALQEKLDESNDLWSSLGKAAKKKRDKSNKRAAVAVLKERANEQEVDFGKTDGALGDSREAVETFGSSDDGDGSEQVTEEVRSAGEQEES